MTAFRTGVWSTASPGRKAGCGLKRARTAESAARTQCITRPKGRVRIETGAGTPFRAGWPRITRPKGRVRIETLVAPQVWCFGSSITRPKGRVRIETLSARSCVPVAVLASPGRKAGCGLKRSVPARGAGAVARASPGRKAGCGLKLHWHHAHRRQYMASPGRKAGCGLKQASGRAKWMLSRHHPAERPGAD